MKAHGLPTLQAEGAIAHMFPDITEDVIRRIDEAMALDDEDAVVDCMDAIVELLDRSDEETIGRLAETVIGGLGQMTRWVANPRVRHAINVSAHVAKNHPYLIEGEFRRLTLLSLRKIREYTAAETTDLHVSDKLAIREAAARLAYRLQESCMPNIDDIPDEIKNWEAICGSEDEFDEIRNQWISVG